MGVLFRAWKAILEGGYGGHPPAVIGLAPLHPQRGRKILRFFCLFSPLFAFLLPFLPFFVFFQSFDPLSPLGPAEPSPPPLGGAGGPDPLRYTSVIPGGSFLQSLLCHTSIDIMLVQ